MKRFISFGSIDPFRTVIKTITNATATMGRPTELPVVVATGTEKIHGTNASVCFSELSGFWVQSRKNLIDAVNNPNYIGASDNASCAAGVYKSEEVWRGIIAQLAAQYNIDLTENIISIYFEWSGGNIQKKSALTGLDKRAMIFRYFKVSPIQICVDNDGEEMNTRWLETIIAEDGGKYVERPSDNIFNVMNFPTVEVTIDFNDPQAAQKRMMDLVDIVERDSLVGEAFGIAGNVGEGYVFTFEHDGEIHRFKVKGEENSKGSGKVPVVAQPAGQEAEYQFVRDFACSDGRMDQMFTEIAHGAYDGDSSLITMRDMGAYLKLVTADVIKEETDRMQEKKFSPKVITGMVAKVARAYFCNRLVPAATI